MCALTASTALGIAREGTISTIAGDGSETVIGGPAGLTVAADGSLYVAEVFANEVSRIEPTGRVVRIANVASPTGVALLPDGRLFGSRVGSPGSGTGAIVRIDPATGRVTDLTN